MLKSVRNISLQSLNIFYTIVSRAEIVIIFEPKMATISARYTSIYEIYKKIVRLYFPKLYNFTMLF